MISTSDCWPRPPAPRHGARLERVLHPEVFWAALVTLMVITDPPGIVPVFLGMTSLRTAAERNRPAWRAAVVALGVIVAFVPLGMPLLAGPGAIVATMLFVQRTNSVGDAVAFGIAIVAVVTVLWLAMRFSGVILRILHDSGVELLTRIAGLLLSAIAVQLIIGAIRTLIKQG